MKSANDLLQLLIAVNTNKDVGFSGIGLILYHGQGNSLPIVSLKGIDKTLHLPILNYEGVLRFLISASEAESPYHDGFHLLNENLQLTHVSQYVSPKIITEVKIRNDFGARFRTAIYSSFLPNVIASGVLSNNYGPTVFEHGNII